MARVSKKAAPAKKAPAKKAAVKKAAPPKAAAPRKITAVSKAMTKTELFTTIADNTGLTRKQVASVFDELSVAMQRHVKKRGVGSFTLPGLMKVINQKVPARKAKKNVPNPFKPGETMDVAARPAFTKVKVRPLKGLKDMVDS